MKKKMKGERPRRLRILKDIYTIEEYVAEL